jgi:hypothetical protein
MRIRHLLPFLCHYYLLNLVWCVFEKSTIDDQLQGNYIVLVISRLGLANRLRTLADWYQIAVETNRKLLFSWEETPDCNVKFSDLFESGPKHLFLLPFVVSSGDSGIRNLERTALKWNLSCLAVYEKDERQMWHENVQSFVLSNWILHSDKRVIVTSYDGLVTSSNTQCQQYMTMHSRFLRSLVPNPSIREYVINLRERFFDDGLMVGVHYRAHEETQDWEVVPPLAGQDHATKFGHGASLEDFVSAMNSIEHKFATHTSTSTGPRRHTGVRFFIASNDDTAKDYFLDHFPNAVSIRGEYSRNSSEGIQFALLEWLLLASSDLVLNTYGSSFAVEAAQVNLVPVVGVWHGRLLHHSSAFLPHCGHMQYAKAYGSQSVATSYVEGTLDARRVVGVSVSMSRCSVLDNWGLTDVLCMSPS